MFPVNLLDLFQKETTENGHVSSGLLRAGSDLNGSLRHTMLRVAGAPSKPLTIASQIRLMHGTLWHEWFSQTLVKHGVPFLNELTLTPYMPEGWGGRADWLFWHKDYNAFVLGDLKTTKGESMYWINQKGAKEDHIWQMSAYYYACLAMGLPMVKGFGVLYWPMNDTTDGSLVLPSLQECEPVPEDVILARMADRWKQVSEYLAVVKGVNGVDPGQKFLVEQGLVEGNPYINDKLAAVQDRIQKLVWSKPQGVFNLVLTPHWSASFCDFPDYCDCSTQGTTKIGHYLTDGEFIPRSGYEDVHPLVRPTLAQLSAKRKEKDASE